MTVVAANVSLPRSPGVRYLDVETAAQLHDACVAEFGSTDVLVMAAAVADFRPASAVDDKIKKSGRDGLSLELEPTTDVLAARLQGQDVRRSAFFDVVRAELGYPAELETVELPSELIRLFV